MLSSHLRSLGFIAAAAGAALGAYASRGTPLASAMLALLCAGLLGLLWSRAGRGRDDDLHDPGISTLVFPPESRFDQPVLPPR
ncbi:hypothetical protein EZ313_15490 [Ramlibacter henchirensis]|uniref:Uncharacterized protein n=1 Tax=Ramlibacter henchirensis TaxID=204072 RepID=A0A4Z0BXG0_9BURK|nr:hypothetical protein [Ramlibacter henchirensis]TFZ02659.1 hypothetical protein EZ313_15490 [Ramlibacter henchirensis]